jgi:16S rRNA (cytidine1402-2'-O)-methyltransferase
MMTHRIDNRTRRQDKTGRSGGVFTAFGLAAEAEPLTPGLHIVATPIGNLKDISFRALSTLAAADAILAEDTRVTKNLLAHYGITTPLVSYNEHSAKVIRPRMMARLQEGQALALVSDAGTPLVSDPGYKLVEAAIAEGVPVTGIPGPSAVISALVLSGLPTDRFFFEGFLPNKRVARRTRLETLSTIPGTLILFEAPHRLPEMLLDASEVLGERKAAVARELTKMFETVRRGTLPELALVFGEEGPPRGEIVVLVGPPLSEEMEAKAYDVLDEHLSRALLTHSIKDAASIVAKNLNLPKRDVYNRAIVLADEMGSLDDGGDDGA